MCGYKLNLNGWKKNKAHLVWSIQTVKSKLVGYHGGLWLVVSSEEVLCTNKELYQTVQKAETLPCQKEGRQMDRQTD